MTSPDALQGLRIGCVKYLNARPLIDTFPGEVQFEHPSDLARDMAAGNLDAALVPVFELFRHPEYVLADDVAIASDGAVYSVFLAYHGKLSEIQRIALDPASLTSVHLLQVLLREYHGCNPECVDAREGEETDAQLLIGNQAITFRESAPADVKILDLGEEWKRCTGLPFVYAAWLLRADLPRLDAIGTAFRELKAEGLAHLDEIVASEKAFSPEFARVYLTEHIRFDLRDAEKQGLRLFWDLAAKHGFVGAPSAPPKYV